ncbi:MAG: OmpA family protein, partial [Chitinophagaceae bacterium]
MDAINTYLNNHASASSLEQSAKNEKVTLENINAQLARPDLPLFSVNKINSPFGDEKGLFAPTAKNDHMIVTSTQSKPSATNVNPYVNRLFTTSLTSNTLQQQMPIVFESLDSSLNQGAASISADGKYLYLTQWKNNETASIYVASKTNEGWSQPLPISLNVQGYNSKQPFCTEDGKYLFFTSDRSGGAGGYDIWYAPLNEDGTTGTAVNAGIMNTSANEVSPFYHQESKTLVYSSDRISGMGGFDLYASKGEINSWQPTENLGHPVNSTRDDMYFISTGKSLLDQAYFSSDRGMECCLALYQVNKAAKKKTITGIIRDCRDESPLSDVLVVLKDASGKTMEYRTGEDGRYTFPVTNDNLSEITITKSKYEGKATGVEVERINQSAWHTDTLMNKTVCLEKKLVIKVENVVTVYFDFDRSLIKERGTEILDSIYQVLMQDTLATIQISGYTDGLGSVEYNAKLSDRRAKACADYLIEKGINPSRISFASFGACCPVEMELINGRDNPDGRSMNRRALINI